MTDHQITEQVSTTELDRRLALLFASEPSAMADAERLWIALRDHGPIHLHHGTPLIISAAAIKKVISDPRATHDTYASGRRADAIRAALPSDGQVAFDSVTAFERLYMSRNDGEAHDRLRRIAQRTFTPVRIARIATAIDTSTQAYLDELAASENPDFMTFAYRLPLRIIGDLLAIPEHDLEIVHGWSGKLGRNRGGTQYLPLMEAHAALTAFQRYIDRHIAGLRAQGWNGDELDLIGDLLDANQAESLSDSELAAMFVILLFAGHETTTNLIGSGLATLVRTGAWERLVECPDLIPNAVEELVRHVSPVQWLGRNIAEPIDVEGHRLTPGDTVLLMIAAGNRDPALFEQPDMLDVERANARHHLGFGRGSHVCLGSQLARMEAISTFRALVARFPNLALPPHPQRWRGNAALRGLTSLPIEL